MRILHFSDVHVPVPLSRLPLRGFVGKRLLGTANLAFNRFRYFEHAQRKLAALAAFADSQEVDLVIFTGDCTNMGTEPEYAAARSAMEGLTRAPLGFIPVPGNHDLYLRDNLASKDFESYFGEFLFSDLPELTVDGKWPSVRLVSDEVAVVAVNSAKPNPQPWRSSGRIPLEQLEALGRVLVHEQVRTRFVFVITHFAPRRPDNRPDITVHGFENGEDFLKACAGLHCGALLHGHIHKRYHLRVRGIAPPIFDAGSATFEGREGIWVFDVGKRKLIAFPGRWAENRYLLDQDAAVQLTCSP